MRAQPLQPTQLHWIALGGALVVGAGLRLWHLGAELEHDEVYTWEVFAAHGYRAILTSYFVPNNHIFHTLLVRLAVGSFGLSEWVVRLPAFLAGVLAIPLFFALAKAARLGSATGLVAAWLIALLPVHIHYSQTARGYTLLVLWAALALLATLRALDGKPWWWLGAGLASFLATHTLVSGIGHLVALGLWAALLCAGRRDWRHLGLALAMGLVAALFVGLAYWPILDQVERAGARWGVAVGRDPSAMLALTAEAAALIVGGSSGITAVLFALLGWLVLARRTAGLALYPILAWASAIGLGLASGIAGQPRSYLYLLIPFVLTAAYGAAEGVPSLLGRLSASAAQLDRTFKSARASAGAVLLLLLGYIWADGHNLRQIKAGGFAAIGRYLTDRASPSAPVVAPFILDRQVWHYAKDPIRQGLLATLRHQSIQHLLLVGDSSDRRFGLDNYLLRLNLVAEDAYQRTLALPPAAFTSVYTAQALTLYQLPGPGQRLFAGGAQGWKIAHLGPKAPIELNPAAPAASQRPSLRIANPAGGRFALQSTEHFAVPANGLLLLVYAKTEQTRTSASLYEVTAAGAEKNPLQMLRTHSDPVLFAGADQQQWLAEAYLLPVRRGQRFGVYILSWETPLQFVGDLACFFFPYPPQP